MSTVTVTLGDLVDKALEELQAPTELGKLVVRPAALTSSETTFLLTDYSATVSDILEFGSELMLVTAKTNAADPTYTVSRGYYGTTAVAHSTNEVGYVNPQWNRQRVANAVKRAFPRLEALGVPLLESTVFTPAESIESDFRFVLEMPSETREVWFVRDDLAEVENWEFIEDLPTTQYSTGKVVKLSRSASLDTDYSVTYRIPYRWSSYPTAPDEDDTIDLPEGAEDLPSAYAVAWLVSAREISRQELDRAMEWNTNEPTRGGVSLRFVQSKWQDFYRQLDEVRRVDPPMPRRTFKRRISRGFWT